MTQAPFAPCPARQTATISILNRLRRPGALPLDPGRGMMPLHPHCEHKTAAIGGSVAGKTRPALFLPLLLLLALALSACGRAGMPQPPSPSKAFAWEELTAVMTGDCIMFTGNFSGAYQYFDGIRLELAGLSGPDDCAGCPFVPEEVTELAPKDTGFSPDAGSVAFSYCPRKAEAYRWRLAGISSHSRMPHATMVDRLLVAAP